MEESVLRGLRLRGVITDTTLIWREGQVEWQRYGDIFGETDAPGRSGGRGSGYARERVAGPATFMIVNASLAIVFGLVVLIFNVGIGTFGALGDFGKNEQLQMIAQAVGGVIGQVIGLIAAIIVLVGALKMKGLTSYGFAMTAAIISLLCCSSPCSCLLAWPAGIWALVVLNDPKVKAAF